MEQATLTAFLDELSAIAGSKTAAARIKSNDRMPVKTKAHMAALAADVLSLDEEHRDRAVSFAKKVGPDHLFDILHSMRRWYSGGTMQYKLLEHRGHLEDVMQIAPQDAVGAYRGFKVDKDNPLAKMQAGDTFDLAVHRNGGFSSWTTSEAAANKFSGASTGKVGIIVQIAGSHGLEPVLAPPERTEPWFNALYTKAVGKSFRPTEGEYLVYGPVVQAKVVRIKKYA